MVINWLNTSCTQKVKSHLILDSSDISELQPMDDKKRCDCLNVEHYYPSEEWTVIEDPKYVNTLINFMNSEDSTNNWNGDNAFQFAKGLLYNSNMKLKENLPMNLPEGNNTPIYPIPWRMTLANDISTSSGKAVFEEYDDDLYFIVNKGKNRNHYNAEVLDKYGKYTDSLFNVFVMPHHPDSVLSKKYKAHTNGIALRQSMIKISIKNITSVADVWKYVNIFNHEVGHTMGLSHSWPLHDGCDDTPPHPNCWNISEDEKCKGPISNNMMDYNASQRALSPCQIAKATRTLHNPKSRMRKLLRKDWCNYNPTKSLYISTNVHLNRHADLKGDIHINNGGKLTISCKVHMPQGSKIIVHQGGELILDNCHLYNDCGNQWDGIFLENIKGENPSKIYKNGIVQLMNLKKTNETIKSI